MCLILLMVMVIWVLIRFLLLLFFKYWWPFCFIMIGKKISGFRYKLNIRKYFQEHFSRIQLNPEK